jgi:hypothetical protein
MLLYLRLWYVFYFDLTHAVYNLFGVDIVLRATRIRQGKRQGNTVFYKPRWGYYWNIFIGIRILLPTKHPVKFQLVSPPTPNLLA